MAKTYLEVLPGAKLALVDASESVGGTWAAERLYPGLKTNNLVGSYEFSDFPMEPDRYGLREGQHIPGQVVHRYLSDFVAHYGIPVRLRTEATSATIQDDGRWALTYRTRPCAVEGPEATTSIAEGRLVAARLVLATGLTSEPSIPKFIGQQDFNGCIMHSKQLKSRSKELSDAEVVVVLGGNKSAWDVCYSAATSGAQVHMVMRPTGGGPSRVWPVALRLLGLFATSIARLSSTRACSWLDPAPFGGNGWLAWLLHRTALGRAVCALFWAHLDERVNASNGYDKHPGTRPLRPWTSTFWMGNSLSIHNYDTNWFDLARKGKIQVHIADVTHLGERAAYLSDGTRIDTDMIVCCTGWKAEPTIKFLPEGLGAQLGLPCSTLPSGHMENNDEEVIAQEARRQLLRDIPYLRHKPVSKAPRNKSLEGKGEEDASLRSDRAVSYRLYRFLVPWQPRFLETRNFAVIGAHLSIHAVLLAQVQALWITAYFQDRLPNLARSDPQALARARSDAFLHAEYERLRHPPEAGGSGEHFPDLVFDSIPYVDMLLRDMGLQTRRKGNWWKEMIEPYRLSDYRAIAQEWQALWI